MKVKVFGPNLRDQSKGQFHVHAADCGDCKHYGPGTRFGGERDEPTIEIATALDASTYVYADHLSDYGLEAGTAAGNELLDNWLSDFWFAPCLKELK